VVAASLKNSFMVAFKEIFATAAASLRNG